MEALHGHCSTRDIYFPIQGYLCLFLSLKLLLFIHPSVQESISQRVEGFSSDEGWWAFLELLLYTLSDFGGNNVAFTHLSKDWQQGKDPYLIM